MEYFKSKFRSERGILLLQLNFTISFSLVSRENPIRKTRIYNTVKQIFSLLGTKDVQMRSCQIASVIVSVPKN